MTVSWNVSPEQSGTKELYLSGEVTLQTSFDISLHRRSTLLSVIPTSQCSLSRRSEMDTPSG